MGDRTAAVKLYNQAVQCMTPGSPASAGPEAGKLAFQFFSSAIWADPTWDEPLFQYGNRVSDIYALKAAVAAWRRALRCNPTPTRKAEILSNLGWRLRDLGETEEAFACAQEALSIDPTMANPWADLALVHGDLGDTSAAVGCWREAVKLEGDGIHRSNFRFGLALALIFDRQLAKGFKEMEVRFEYRLKNFLSYPYPRWEGQKDAQVFIQADQGLGDTLSFARFVPAAAARARYVHLYVQEQLMRVFQHAFMHLPNVNIIPFQPTTPFPAADYWSTFISLPAALDLTDEEIRNTPHIGYPDYSIRSDWKVPDQKLHVGIAWAGSPQNDIDRHRSIPVECFLELYRVAGVQLYSLQVDSPGSQRKGDLYTTAMSGLVKDLSPFISDISDTTALLKGLDLVICCESALAHICGLVSRECWIPYSYLGRDYRIGVDGKDVLWYPNHRVFPQDKTRSWEKVFEHIVGALAQKVKEHRRAA